MANVPSFVAALYQHAEGWSGFWRISNPAARAANEGGIDIPNPGGTPVYALADGTLQSNHLFWHNPPDVANPHGGGPGYGVLTQRVNVPGYGINDLYYQHIDLNPAIPTCLGGNCGGYIVHKGQLIGWTRANVGEVEVGVNPAGWGPVWGPDTHPGPWVDPETRIRALVNADPAFPWGTGVSTADPNVGGTNTGTSSTGSTGTPANVVGFGVKAGIFLLALVFFGFGIYLLFKPQIDAKLAQGGSVAKTLGKVALL